MKRLYTSFVFFTGLLLLFSNQKCSTMSFNLSEEIDSQIKIIEEELDYKIVFNESEIELVDSILVEKLRDGSISQEIINDKLFLPIITFIGEVYKRNYGGELINSGKDDFSPSSFRCRNGNLTSDYLALYMQYQNDLRFLTHHGFLVLVYRELVIGCRSRDGKDSKVYPEWLNN